ncbi:MAG: hypothetical protein WD750_05885 [Gammaproteobacteria bacterium]
MSHTLIVGFTIDDDVLAGIDRLIGTGFGTTRGEVIGNVLAHALRRNESIGRCEICGVVDHHLIEGACPLCRVKYDFDEPEVNHG